MLSENPECGMSLKGGKTYKTKTIGSSLGRVLEKKMELRVSGWKTGGFSICAKGCLDKKGQSHVP